MAFFLVFQKQFFSFLLRFLHPLLVPFEILLLPFHPFLCLPRFLLPKLRILFLLVEGEALAFATAADLVATFLDDDHAVTGHVAKTHQAIPYPFLDFLNCRRNLVSTTGLIWVYERIDDFRDDVVENDNGRVDGYDDPDWLFGGSSEAFGVQRRLLKLKVD